MTMKNIFYLAIPFLLFFSYILIHYIHNYIPIKIAHTFFNVSTQEKKTKTIKLLVWNVHKENQEEKFKKNLEKINNAYYPNHILLQEYLFRDKRNINLGKNYVFAPNLYQSSSGNFSGIINISNSISEKNIPILSKGLEPILLTPKIALATIYLLNEQLNLMIINIHALNFQLNNKAFQEQIRSIVKLLDNHKGPKIFAGDFNTWNNSKTEMLFNMMRTSRMTAVDFGHEEKNIKSVFGNRLDHIFYSADSLKVVKKKVIEKICSSDHMPLYVEFGVNINEIN
jgi:endonuclease/exonuclease/phosphatase (EEP) superfamily protein YafD